LTRILACRCGERQILAVDLEVSTSVENFLVLPLPVPPGRNDIVLVDVVQYPNLFADIEELFDRMLVRPMHGYGPVPRRPLVPRRAEAMIAPTVAALTELAPPFRSFSRDAVEADLSGASLFDQLQSRYADRAFVVARIEPGGGQIPAVGVDFPSRFAALFFPTLRIQSGVVSASLAWDHALYAQRARLGERSAGLLKSVPPDPATLAPFLDGEAEVDRALVRGEHPNHDVYVEMDR